MSNPDPLLSRALQEEIAYSVGNEALEELADKIRDVLDKWLDDHSELIGAAEGAITQPMLWRVLSNWLLTSATAYWRAADEVEGKSGGSTETDPPQPQ